MKKYLQLLADGSIHSFHEDLAEAPRFRVVRCPADVDPHEHFARLAAEQRALDAEYVEPAQAVALDDGDESAFPAEAVAAAESVTANEAPEFVSAKGKRNA